MNEQKLILIFILLKLLDLHKQPPEVCNFIKKESLEQVFSKNTFFPEHLWTTDCF